MIMCGQSPSVISGVPKIASSAAMTRSHAEREAEAAGEGVALHAGDRGLPERVEVAEEVGQLTSGLVQVAEAATVRHSLQVGTCTERGRSRAGEHHHAHGIVGLGELERVAELTDQRP